MCSSHEYKIDSYIYGDAINYSGGYRTIMKCKNCGKYKFIKEFLNE